MKVYNVSHLIRLLDDDYAFTWGGLFVAVRKEEAAADFT